MEQRKGAPHQCGDHPPAKKAANVTEEAHTWAEWQSLGYEVVRGSKAIFRAVLIWASRGDGRQYMASFFGASQVRPLAA